MDCSDGSSRKRAENGDTWIMLCRAGFEDALAEEIARAAPAHELHIATQPGWLRVDSPAPRGSFLAATPYVFERQRLPRAEWCAELDTAQWAALLATRWNAALARDARPWTLHAFAPNPGAEDSLTRAAHRLGAALRQALGTAQAGLAGRYVAPEQAVCVLRQELGGVLCDSRPRRDRVAGASRQGLGGAPRTLPAGLHVLQVCRVPGGAWTSLAPGAEISDPWPGGVHRVPDDVLAPSRSFAKIEEAFDVMGSAPTAGETAVDLGAAPGGWSWAFVKRGCRVMAVDNGPVKLKSLGGWGGELQHIRHDGMTFTPPRPVDWLACDMLVAPGAALGLVRKWHLAGWTRRMIVNFKLPQRHPLAAVEPVRAALDALPGFRYRLRQLFHDRREVTLMAECERTPPVARRPRRHLSRMKRR